MPIKNMTRFAARPATLAFAIALCVIPPFVGNGHAEAASFNCDLSTLTGNERTICNNRSLNDDDVKMSTMYTMLRGLFAMGMSGLMADNQRTWLKQRESCGTNVACTSKAYQARINQLQKIYDSINKPL